MVAGGHGPRSPRRPSGQHVLRSGTIAEELVRAAGVSSDDLVVEIGAGAGRLTQALAACARRVVAIELDPDLASRLRRSVGVDAITTIVEADALQAPLPSEPYRVVGNLPFAETTRILRRLLDHATTPLSRADVIVQYEVARKPASVWPSSLRSLCWAPWWEFSMVRRLASACFEPPPSVDAGMLSVTRRSPSLLDPRQRARFERLIERAYRRSELPVWKSISLSALGWKRFARERGITRDATPAELDVFDWVALYRRLAR